jgi:cytochrome c oxidase assembly protein subunit 15
MVAIRHRVAIASWLLVSVAAVFAMICIGGITRLTESGLSMVEWRPLIGIFPPVSETEWQRIFELYQKTPEYVLINRGMDLAAFKLIFWWEYIHRLWGRLIGVIFTLPFVFFLVKGWLTPRLIIRLVGLLALGALQGLIGWWMVKSGLTERPDVSQYRLAVHLVMALIILACLFYLALTLLIPQTRRVRVRRSLYGHAWLVVAAVLATMVSGAFVAGTNAGLIYNTFPLMGGRLLPAEYAHMAPFWLNWFENPAAIQFNHRLLACGTFVVTAMLWWRCRNSRINRANHVAVTTLMAVACLQVSLGIVTLVTIVPIPLAATHQGVAVLLLLSAVATAFTLQPRGKAVSIPIAAVPA